MAIDDNVVFRVEFLMCAARDVAHRDQLRAFDSGSIKFPRFADIEKRKSLFALRHSLHRRGINFVVHQVSLVAATSRWCDTVIRLARVARTQTRSEPSSAA